MYPIDHIRDHLPAFLGGATRPIMPKDKETAEAFLGRLEIELPGETDEAKLKAYLTPFTALNRDRFVKAASGNLQGQAEHINGELYESLLDQLVPMGKAAVYKLKDVVLSKKVILPAVAILAIAIFAATIITMQYGLDFRTISEALQGMQHAGSWIWSLYENRQLRVAIFALGWPVFVAGALDGFRGWC